MRQDFAENGQALKCLAFELRDQHSSKRCVVGRIYPLVDNVLAINKMISVHNTFETRRTRLSNKIRFY